MQRPKFLIDCLFLSIALASPLLVRAQFQAPTDDELKMTSDPKAPGAAAVYLYREETTDDDRHFHTYYARIKVLTEKGKDLATVRIPYERGESKVEHIEGRTIHADGKVIPLSVKPEDLVDIKTKHLQVDTIVFTLPEVDVGSILEYRLQVRYNDELVVSPTWQLQQPYFVHKEHFMFHPNVSAGYIRNNRGMILSQLMWISIGPTDQVKVQSNKNYYTIDVADVSPTPDDDWMPPLNSINWKAAFYYTYATSRADYWSEEGKWWATIINAFIQPTDTLKKAVAGIVSPTDTDEQKARKIYAAVLKLDNTDFSRVKSEAERKKEKLKEISLAEDVWKQQSGNGYAIALLYAAMARAAGLKAWPMRVVNRDDALFDIGDLEVSQFDDYVVRLVIDGKDIWTDPAEKMCPFGSLFWTHTLAGGLRMNENGAEIANTPAAAYKDNLVQNVADLSVDADGNVTGTARILLSGADAVYWRQVALKDGEDEAKKRFIEDQRGDLPEGIQADFDHFINLDNIDGNLMAVVKISGQMGTATGKRYLLPGLFFESRAKHPFVAQVKRDTPIDVHYPKMEQEVVSYDLPAGYTVESSPVSSDVTWPGYGALRIKSETKADGTLEVSRVFARGFTLLGPESYNNLHDFYQKLAAADQQQIVLLRNPAAKGN
ncbi:MAG: DUF3857 domain-containing protein [Terracidiphilus sp.]